LFFLHHKKRKLMRKTSLIILQFEFCMS